TTFIPSSLETPTKNQEKINTFCPLSPGFPQAAAARGRSPHIGAVACGDVKKGVTGRILCLILGFLVGIAT
ncbi:hypothetical protein, partial [Mobiluncus mulieris]